MGQARLLDSPQIACGGGGVEREMSVAYQRDTPHGATDGLQRGQNTPVVILTLLLVSCYLQGLVNVWAATLSATHSLCPMLHAG